MANTQAQSAGTVAADTLTDWLAPESGERAVLSAVYQDYEGVLTVRHASVLIGPEEMSTVSWGGWRSDYTSRLKHNFGALSQLPPELLVEDARTERGTPLVAGRACLSVGEARQLLASVLERGVVPATGPLPEATVQVGAPDSFVRVFPRLWTPLSRLAANAVRPLRGFFMPRAHPLGELIVADRWTADGVTTGDGAWSLLGIAMPHTGHRLEAAPEGLLVGRLERRAWFNDIKGDGDFNLYHLYVGWEPERIDLADLEVELEEWAGGELATSRRLLLGELALGARAGDSRAVVGLSTLGRGFAHEARLYDREGALLDRTQRSKLMEQIRARGTATTPDGETATWDFTVGESVIPTLNERLERFERVEEDYRKLLEDGLEERIVRDRQTGITAIHNHLAAAAGEIWVMDPYFGAHSDDWDVLKGLSVPVKVLSGPSAQRPPAGLAHVQILCWNGPRRTPPFHDRTYLWETGGLTVGTSPSGFGKRDSRIDRIRRTEVDRLRADFGHYWNSGDFVPV